MARQTLSKCADRLRGDWDTEDGGEKRRQSLPTTSFEPRAHTVRPVVYQSSATRIRLFQTACPFKPIPQLIDACEEAVTNGTKSALGLLIGL